MKNSRNQDQSDRDGKTGIAEAVGNETLQSLCMLGFIE